MKNLTNTLLLLFSCNLFAGGVKPFWTEKSSYIEGKNLYVVGIATEASSIEKGRKIAFENGKNEVMNFSQLSNIEGLAIETQMTFEEPNGGKHSVYRLMFVNYDKLNSLISKKIAKSKQNYEKHQKKQEEEIKIKTIALKKLKMNTDELSRLDIEYNKIANNIESQSEKALRYVKSGMTKDEVKHLLGEPRTTNTRGGTSDNYGKYWVVYSNPGFTVACLSTSTHCANQYKSLEENCNSDMTICKEYGTISYHYKMIE